jgi:hypothetical protein
LSVTYLNISVSMAYEYSICPGSVGYDFCGYGLRPSPPIAFNSSTISSAIPRTVCVKSGSTWLRNPLMHAISDAVAVPPK